MPRTRFSSNDSTADLGFEAKLWLAADTLLAKPPFNDSDTALHASAFFQTEAKAKDNFRKDDDARWQFGVPPRGNTNFAWVQHFIHHLAPHGMAGFVLVRRWFWVKSKASRAIKLLDNPTPHSFRERRRVLTVQRHSLRECSTAHFCFQA